MNWGKIVGNFNLFVVGFCLALALAALHRGDMQTFLIELMMSLLNAIFAWVNLSED